MPHGSHHSFPHFWEQMFGSGRAILTLRESYRQDLRLVKDATDFKYVRFHAILHDEVGIYDEDKHGNPIYNFSYVDQIYDGLLANGVRPYVELSFMPSKLASRQAVHSFKYHPIVAPPRDYAKWDALIAAFAAHLIDRYGIDEVAQWYFEVWNEPNLDFWAGQPKQSSYWTLIRSHRPSAEGGRHEIAGRRAVHGASCLGRVHSFVIAPRKASRSILYRRMCTPTTLPKMFSGLTKIFRAPKWCAVRRRKSATKSTRRRVAAFPSSGASTTPRTSMSRRSPTHCSWGRGLRIRCVAATGLPT